MLAVLFRRLSDVAMGRRSTLTVTAIFVVGAIATGCGVEAKSDHRAARVCESLQPLLEARRSLDALDRQRGNVERVVTPADELRRLSLIYRGTGTAYADLERAAKSDTGRIDVGESSEAIKRMWRQLVASAHERKIEMWYFADAFARPRELGAVTGWNNGHRAVVARANAKYFAMDSVMNKGLADLGLKHRPGVFSIDC
jgi:hypothetical protein